MRRGRSRKAEEREREATRVGRSKIALVARSVGAETGGVASLRPWQIAIYEQWASIVKKRHVTSAVFAVRALCFPLPLCFHPFSRGRKERRGLFYSNTTLLFSSLGSISRRPETGFLPRLFCQSEATREERERVVGGYTHDALIGKVGWKRRGDTIEGTSGSVERARDGGKFDADAVGPCWKGFRKKGRVSPARSLRGGANKGNRCALRVLSPWTSKSLARVFPSIWTVRSVVFATFFISLENFSSIDFGRKRFLLQYVRWFSCDIYQERVTIIFICEKKISRTYIFWFLFAW